MRISRSAGFTSDVAHSVKRLEEGRYHYTGVDEKGKQVWTEYSVKWDGLN
jgi:hypothetical protein